MGRRKVYRLVERQAGNQRGVTGGLQTIRQKFRQTKVLLVVKADRQARE